MNNSGEKFAKTDPAFCSSIRTAKYIHQPKVGVQISTFTTLSYYFCGVYYFLSITMRRIAKKKDTFMSDKKVQNQINIELPEEVAEGIYSNLAIISHSHSEFVVDYIRMMPNVPKAKVKARVILTPQHAKRMLRALADNVQKFEAQFGTIAENDLPSYPNMNFNTPPAQA